MAYLEETDKVLVSKGLPPLTDEEKGKIKARCQNAILQWQMTPKATGAEYALKKQLTLELSNAIFDVLVETRKYQ